MPREHADIKMTTEELRAFLAADTRLILATLDENDQPWADAAAYRFHDGRVYFRIPTRTRSFRNIRRDSRVCCVVESKPTDSSYYDIQGAMLHGAAEELIAGQGAGVRQQLATIADPVTPDRRDRGAVFSVGLDDATSFVFNKIRYRYQDRSL